MRSSEGWFQLTGYEVFHLTTGRDRGNWDQLDPVSRESWEQRARGEREFIPSPNHHNREEATTVVLPMPAPDFPVQTITPSETLYERVVPAAAQQMADRLKKHGWAYDVRYCVGPWPKKTETTELADGSEEKVTYGQAPSVVLRFRRDGVVGYAMWLAKPWTKDGDKLKFHAAQIRPGVGLIKSNDLIKLVTAPRQSEVSDSAPRSGGRVNGVPWSPGRLGGDAARTLGIRRDQYRDHRDLPPHLR
jgi:hypothetical protein